MAKRNEAFKELLRSASEEVQAADVKVRLMFNYFRQLHNCLYGDEIDLTLESFLVSKDDCALQGWHFDGNPKAADFKRRSKTVTQMTPQSMSLIVSLSDSEEGALWYYPGSHHVTQALALGTTPSMNKKLEPVKLTLRRGDFALFRQDLLHRGGAYSGRHLRCHVYGDAKGVKRVDDNATYFVKELFPEYRVFFADSEPEAEDPA